MCRCERVLCFWFVVMLWSVSGVVLVFVLPVLVLFAMYNINNFIERMNSWVNSTASTTEPYMLGNISIARLCYHNGEKKQLETVKDENILCNNSRYVAQHQ